MAVFINWGRPFAGCPRSAIPLLGSIFGALIIGNAQRGLRNCRYWFEVYLAYDTIVSIDLHTRNMTP